MAKSKKKAADPAPAASKPNRTGKPIHVWVEEPVFDSLEAFRDAQRLKPKLKDVVELALQEFLQREGYWPPKSA